MPRHDYREHDYTFGQAMLKLRTSIGLTQAALAQLLGVSRRAVGEWEVGSSYPKFASASPPYPVDQRLVVGRLPRSSLDVA